MNLRVILDWETAYGKHPETGENITLSRMTTEEYVRHKLFKVHGLGVKINGEAPFWLTGQELLHFLKTHPWGRTWAIAHHAHFDAAILSWRAGIRPALWGCTLSMARAVFPHEAVSLANIARVLGVGEKGVELANFSGKWTLTPDESNTLGNYCLNDIDLTADIFDALKGHFPPDELRLIDMTVRMFAEPAICVDPAPLVTDYAAERRRKRRLVKECIADAAELASNDKMAALLLTLGVDPPKKLSAIKVKDGRVDPDNAGEPPVGLLPDFKAPKGAPVEVRAQLKEEKRLYPWSYAFGKSDEAFILLEEHPDERVRAVVDARLGVKSTLRETRSKRFYKIGRRGAFPVYLTYYGAHTGRWSGGDKQNAQNMGRIDPKDPSSGALRRSWIAPPGHVLVVRDLGQIEARMLAYWAGQDDLVELFRQGGDPYNRQASKIFGYEVNRKLAQFWLEGLVGKSSTLGNGYGMGWGKFQGSLRVGFMGAPPLLFDRAAAEKLGADIDVFCHTRSYKRGYATLREEALAMQPLNVGEIDHLWHCAATKSIVDKFRESNPAVVASWKEAGAALGSILRGELIPVGKHDMVTTCSEGLRLPNGMLIRYHKLRCNDRGEYRYLANARKKEWTYIYGGKVVENCISEGTFVLTDSGWKSIENVTSKDKVHDGIDFVTHGGVVYSGFQACTVVDGVYMTPDHEVLTNETWKPAAEITPSCKELIRPGLWRTDSNSPGAFGWKETFLGVSLSVRTNSGKSWSGCNERSKPRWNAELRVPDKDIDVKRKPSTWNVAPSCVRGLAVYVGQMPIAVALRLEKLRRAGHKSVQTLASCVRTFLERYGANLSTWVVSRSDKQQRTILSKKLSMGIDENSSTEQAQQCVHRYVARAANCCAGSPQIWHRTNYDTLSHSAPLAVRQVINSTESYESRGVYDIMNCGPHRRFVILGFGGPFIVHNCVQALSRIVIAEHMLNTQRWLRAQDDGRGIYKVVTMTHDEIVCCVPEHRGQDCLNAMERIMATPPHWCADLPLKSSGGFAVSYGDCEK